MVQLLITEKARKQLELSRKEKNVAENFLIRIGTSGGNCGISGYQIGFDEKKEDDFEYEIEGFRFIIDKRHAMHVIGMELDYIEEPDRKGFVFNNPAARKRKPE